MVTPSFTEESPSDAHFAVFGAHLPAAQTLPTVHCKDALQSLRQPAAVHM